jgi:hypothetical protein
MSSLLLHARHGYGTVQMVFLIVALALSVVGAKRLKTRFFGGVDGTAGQSADAPMSEQVIRRMNAELE